MSSVATHELQPCDLAPNASPRGGYRVRYKSVLSMIDRRQHTRYTPTVSIELFSESAQPLERLRLQELQDAYEAFRNAIIQASATTDEQ